MRLERFSLFPGDACTYQPPDGARAAFALVQRWYVARNHHASGSSLSAPPGASGARPARIAEPTPASASALRRKPSAPRMLTSGRVRHGRAACPFWSGQTSVGHVCFGVGFMCMQSNVLRHFSIKWRAHFLLTCATTCALRCRITDYGPQHSSARAIPACRR